MKNYDKMTKRAVTLKSSYMSNAKWSKLLKAIAESDIKYIASEVLAKDLVCDTLWHILLADYLGNGKYTADADANSNLYYWMRSALKPFSRIDPNTDKLTKYYSKPTEQKAYMNQLREFMYANKMIDTRDQIVTPDLIKQAISKLPKGMQSIKKASEQFKSMRSYTKWFNTIPLLGVGAVGANKYFTSNENRD